MQPMLRNFNVLWAICYGNSEYRTLVFNITYACTVGYSVQHYTMLWARIGGQRIEDYAGGLGPWALDEVESLNLISWA